MAANETCASITFFLTMRLVFLVDGRILKGSRFYASACLTAVSNTAAQKQNPKQALCNEPHDRRANSTFHTTERKLLRSFPTLPSNSHATPLRCLHGRLP